DDRLGRKAGQERLLGAAVGADEEIRLAHGAREERARGRGSVGEDHGAAHADERSSWYREQGRIRSTAWSLAPSRERWQTGAIFRPCCSWARSHCSWAARASISDSIRVARRARRAARPC